MRYFHFFIGLISFCVYGQSYHQYVNPMIGTDGTGHTFPGATAPFGMVQLSPDTRIDGSWEGCSGYHYSDNRIYGFSHTHLNGTGVSDFGDILLMPIMGEPTFDNQVYSSMFSHANEKAKAGFYQVKLDRDGIVAQLTASPRVGFHVYTFPKAGDATVVLDLRHRDEWVKCSVKPVDDRSYIVYRQSKGWAANQQVWGYLQFETPMEVRYQLSERKNATGEEQIDTVGAFFAKKVQANESIRVKVALSPTSSAGAQLNASEIPHWDFDQVVAQTQQLWDTELRKIEIESDDSDKLAVFYTAMYHLMTQPNIAQDLDGTYRGRDQQLHKAVGFDYYSVFSLWDTFRAAHPLFALIDKKRTSDFINTFLKQYEQGGRLPVWELASNETDCMIGYHSVSVMADAMTKNITGFDYDLALDAAVHSARLDHLGLSGYKANGFVAIDDDHESVSKTLEYAYDDWCIAQMAAIVGNTEIYNEFMLRSQNWKNLFDWESGFMRAKRNGGWESPFDPKEINNHFTEGNSWQYSFFVPHAVSELIAAHGGYDAFEAKLDQLFTESTQTTGRHQVDVTGLIGQYAHGNEPSHHMAYLYNHINRSDKTNRYVRQILDDFYLNTPNGLIGNEDCGQMSAWYILSALGFYSMTPGDQIWETTIPYFPKATIHFEDGAKQIITPATPEEELRYIGFTADDMFAYFHPNPIVVVPVIQAESATFKSNLTIELKHPESEITLLYRFKKANGHTSKWKTYTKPFSISESITVEAIACEKEVRKAIEKNQFVDAAKRSKSISASYFKQPNDWKVTLNAVPNRQYFAGGPEGLIDGVSGDVHWRKGNWHGYQSQDFEAIIDLKKNQKVQSIQTTFLQDSRSWILLPTQIEYAISTNGKDFVVVDTINMQVDTKDMALQIRAIESTYKNQAAQYVRVRAKNWGKLPEGHQGFGGDAFIFVDEITIK